MSKRFFRRVAIALAAAGAGTIASAQQPAGVAPPAAVAPSAVPAFASPNLTEDGARALAANCAICHGTGGRAVPGSTVAGLAGRSREELVLIMAQFRDGARPATIMHQIAKSYSDAEVAAIAAWFASQPR
jgi:cytochrome c553